MAQLATLPGCQKKRKRVVQKDLDKQLLFGMVAIEFARPDKLHVVNPLAADWGSLLCCSHAAGLNAARYPPHQMVRCTITKKFWLSCAPHDLVHIAQSWQATKLAFRSCLWLRPIQRNVKVWESLRTVGEYCLIIIIISAAARLLRTSTE